MKMIRYVKKNIAAAYANILASELFMPLDSDDKSIAYAPFHCIANYFHSSGYSGIIYQSTVYDKVKSLVLFDKNLAVPVESSIVTYSLT